ncbi:ATPase family AAA domain-containing protein 5b isoform X2 [Anabas testudineus]|uniref:ATPase family AAA domain-containing protein 5b isoform X2 n=1 Tax=Anabas testudineus TaxID=64144 RepID=UPI000E45FBDB|nr:ATPase family AAA domain-containing protein 5b isoform X2 [Anabas testudineus]
MPNKHKRSKNSEETTCPSKNHVLTTDVKIAPIFFRCTSERRKWSRRAETTVELSSNSEDVQRVKGQQLLSASTVCRLPEEEGFHRSSGRGQLPPSALNISLTEIQTSNPTFPVQTVFSSLQKKASGELQHLGATAEISLYPNPQQSYLKEKRKRGDEGCEAVSKRLRCSFTAERAAALESCHLPAQPVQESKVLQVTEHHRSSKLSRTRRLRQQSGRSAGAVSSCDLKSEWTNHRESDSQSLITTGFSFEDVLWTDKYSPRHSSEVIGNSASVKKLNSWLKKWKLRAASDERKKTEEGKQEENNSWDCGDFQGEAGAGDNREETLCNTVLITGPPGVGKTASVYACAQELGFKRSGRHVLSQLKEATQSHLVETSGKDPLKPAYFKNYTTNSCTPKADTLPEKTVHPKNVISTTKKRATKSGGRCGRKGKANPVTLASYFKMQAKADHLHFGGPLSSEKPNTTKLGNPSPGCDQTVPQSKKTATSLILFEEVDVIFEDDVGFLAAIKTFMTTTKRPVILTTNDPTFRERFSCSLEEITFKTPPAESVCSYLQLVGLAEKVQLDFDDVSSLLRLTRGDVRRCLLQLQLWVHSGGGRASQSEVRLKEPTCVPYSDATQGGGSLDSQVPPRQTGCTASMVGLELVTQIQLLNHLKTQYWSERDMNKLLMLLAESWRGRVPLLYSNLELLLPVHTDLHNHAVSKTINGKHVRNISRLSRKKYNTTCDTTSSSMKQRTSLSVTVAPSRAPTSCDKIEQNTAKVETVFLDALTDFFDLMSYLDATLQGAAPLVSGSCRPEALVWTGAEIKDGLLDETNEEECRSWSQERLLNIQAAVEGLGCHKCCWRLSEVWSEARTCRQKEEDNATGSVVAYPATSTRQELTFTVRPLCAPSVSQRRYELSRAVFGSESFSLLGNRKAVSVDYMPVLRSICRFQRAQQQREEPVRCMNYLSGSQLGLSNSTLKLLAEDFS